MAEQVMRSPADKFLDSESIRVRIPSLPTFGIKAIVGVATEIRLTNLAKFHDLLELANGFEQIYISVVKDRIHELICFAYSSHTTPWNSEE